MSILWAVLQLCADVLRRGTPLLCFSSVFILNILPFFVSEDTKETQVVIVNASSPALSRGCVHTAYSTNTHSLAGSSLASAEYTHGIVCPVKVECDVFLTVLLSSFTDLESRRGVALLTVLLSFLMPFKLLRFFLWLYGKIYFWLCHLPLLLVKMFSFICNSPCLFLLQACF